MISRREFFRTGFRGALHRTLCAAEVVGERMFPEPPPRPPHLRPPGALPEPAFRQACTGCDACIIACPKYALRKAGRELGPGIEGTPVVVPEEQPCWLCPDFPCITACETGALVPVADAGEVRMGTVQLAVESCYSAQGNICEACAERCPVEPRAIRVPFGGPPMVDPELCAGCGVCAWLCPADALRITAPTR